MNDAERIKNLQSQVAALEQLLEVHESAVKEQTAKLENAYAELADRVAELAETNTRLEHTNRRLHDEIVERRRAEENLRETERLASIGTLAAGIAHEINNPLGLMLLEIHKAKRSPEDPAVVREAFELIGGYVAHCAQIVKSVLRFAREEATEKWMASVNEVAEKARDLTLGKTGGDDVRLDFELADSLPHVLINPTELEQLFVHLIDNAVRACGEAGEIRVATKLDGDRVCITVSDNGCGMDEDVQEKVFEPFFTTHSKEGGKGLGLATCRAVVRALGGGIKLESAPGEGTLVTVDLPRGDMVYGAEGTRGPKSES